MEEKSSGDDNGDDMSIGSELTTGSDKNNDMTEEEKIVRGLSDEQDEEERRVTEDIIKKTKRHTSGSWLELANYVDKIAFIPIKERLMTKFWFSLEKHLRDKCKMFPQGKLEEVRAEVDDIIENAKALYGINDGRETVWRVIKGVGGEIAKRTYRTDEDIMKVLSLVMRLSRTDKDVVENVQLDRTLKEDFWWFWIAGVQLFGNTGENMEATMIFKDEEAKELNNDRWKNIKELTTDRFEAKEFLKVSGKYPWKELETANDLEGKDKRKTSVYEWKAGVTMALLADNRTVAQKALLKFIVKMANTPPNVIPGWEPLERTLMNNPFSMAWVGIHQVFGRTWKKELCFDSNSKTTSDHRLIKRPKKIPPKSMPKNTPKKAPKSSYKTTPSNGKNSMFVQRESIQPKVYKLSKEWDRAHTTYIKIRMSPIDPDPNIFHREFSRKAKEFLEILNRLWEVDQTLVVTGWKESEKIEPLTAESKTQPTRDFLGTYVESFYIATGRGGSYIRCRIRHNTSYDEIVEHPNVESLASEIQANIYLDKIQAQVVKQAGWLAGSIDSRIGVTDLENAMKQQPMAIDNNIKDLEIRILPINNRKGRLGKDDPKVFAMHVFCAAEIAGVVRKLLSELYPAKPKSHYPMGRHMRFVPNMADTQVTRTPDLFEKAERLKTKQGIFLENLCTYSTRTIKKLLIPMASEPFLTLAEILMAWKSVNFKDEKLFVAVEEIYGATTFYFHKNRRKEAETIVQLLSIIMEGEYGPGVNEWFHEDAEDTLKNYRYSSNTKMIEKFEPLQVESDEEWEMGVRDERPNQNVTFLFEIGTIDLDNNDRGAIVDDDSVGSFNPNRQQKIEQKEPDKEEGDTKNPSVVEFDISLMARGGDKDDEDDTSIDLTVNSGLSDGSDDLSFNSNVSNNESDDGKETGNAKGNGTNEDDEEENEDDIPLSELKKRKADDENA